MPTLLGSLCPGVGSSKSPPPSPKLLQKRRPNSADALLHDVTATEPPPRLLGQTPGTGTKSPQAEAVQAFRKAAQEFGLRFPRQRRQSRRARDSLSDSAGSEVSSQVSQLLGSPRDLSPTDRAFLTNALQRHFLFQDLEEGERSDIVAHMAPQQVEVGAVICEQGDVGDSCYVIQKGSFDIAIDGKVVKNLGEGQIFGELAMLYRVNRTASVLCSEAGVVWKMDGRCFRLCMQRLTNKHMQRAMTFLQMDPSFRAISETERRKLAGACAVQKFARGEQVMRSGEPFHCLFIVVDGTLKIMDSHGQTSLHRAGAILGCASLMMDRQAVVHVEAVDNVTCLVVAKHCLDRLIGPVEDVLRRSAVKALLGNCSMDVEIMRQLTEDQQNVFVDRMHKATFDVGDVVASQGSAPVFLLVTEGMVAVTHMDGEAKQLTAGMVHGASNLVDNTPMREEVVAMARTTVHRISYKDVLDVFKGPLNELFRFKEVKKALGEILLFKNLNEEQVDRVVRCLERQSYNKGDVIVRQGDQASQFFLIQSGSVRITRNGQQVRSLGRWDYFGERALLLQENRTATVVAQERTVCLILGNAVFHTIVGMFRKELEHRMRLQDEDISMADLRVKAVVGRGNFGVVKLVYHRSDEKRRYALKCVDKQLVVQQNQEKLIVMEREMNALCYHPCIVQFVRTFQDTGNVYFLTEFLGGGELFRAMRDIGMMNKAQCRFYGASMVLALEYLHGRGIIYRDLKPENVMLDERGFAKLVDFGCCKKAMRTSTVVGTPEYMAPEMIAMLGYTCAVDWWALGVVMHELIVGPPPFGADSEDEMSLFRAIREAPLRIPSRISDSAATALITGLLKRTPELRLGASKQGATEIKDHAYFLDFDWDGIAGRYLEPPWRPNLEKLQSQWEPCGGEPVVQSLPPTPRTSQTTPRTSEGLAARMMGSLSHLPSGLPHLPSLPSFTSIQDLVGQRRSQVPRGMEWAVDF